MKTQEMITGRIMRTGAVAVLALAGVACASSQEIPDRQLASAETGVEFAQENGAREYGPAALKRAETQLEQARKAAADEEYDRALYLAERAELDAELAMAQTNHQKAAVALEEIRQSIRDLQAEIARLQSS